MKALLVSPKFVPTYWSYESSLRLGGRKCLLPPLGLLTVAALLPRHWRPELVDLNVEPLTDRQILRSDVVMLTGMHVQSDSLHEVLRRCRKLGVPTVVGGPYASGEPHKVEGEADHLVLGEVEKTLLPFCQAFEAGLAPRVTPRPDAPGLEDSPPPRYDLLRRGIYYHMSLQFSRGCPFTCEFCDIPSLLGRNPRTKTPEQILHELDAIKASGFRGMVFFVEDNFIGKKKAVRELLPRVERWQRENGWPFEFYTEASLNLAEDPALMEAMTSAGFRMVFVGLESPSPESIKETKKNQNLPGDMLQRVHTILGHGLEVLGGFIVGFDSDRADIFDRQVEFIQKAAIPTAMLGVLQALPGAPLETRMRAEGRLRDMPRPKDQFGRSNFDTVLPAPVLLAGYRRTLEALYEPSAYFARVKELLRLRRRLPAIHRTGLGTVVSAVRAIVAQGVLASYRRDYWRFLADVWRTDRTRIFDAMRHAAPGHHFFLFTREVVRKRLEAALESRVTPAEAREVAAVQS
ncbi:MAG TPA: B12-binding domain-containing radical SAM protein [Vicinamibacteria bacterium]|nr:B12-binding domain-containing radical SAM protein [Vicinamibacteria bacterium]